MSTSAALKAVAIYARISHDAEGRGAGVRRQIADCRKLADSLGWDVADVYVDNDVSAFSGKRRPEYKRMMSDLADWVLDGVIVYNIDRLTRRPAELEAFAIAVTLAGVRQVKFVTGDVNLGTDDGLLMARVSEAFAAKESANTSRRLRRKAEQTAAEGLPIPGRFVRSGTQPTSSPSTRWRLRSCSIWLTGSWPGNRCVRCRRGSTIRTSPP
ncbi:hypothetical protein GCM10009737_10560 [Nocardioides lentus]|uniref:Resolvase/invertase-type recombinase catalytic domain-containing protein n=1 Tax=Nocardioides lentus TaxID=338077 RepID=A0ABP5ADG7_9ACTN